MDYNYKDLLGFTIKQRQIAYHIYEKKFVYISNLRRFNLIEIFFYGENEEKLDIVSTNELVVFGEVENIEKFNEMSLDFLTLVFKSQGHSKYF